VWFCFLLISKKRNKTALFLDKDVVYNQKKNTNNDFNTYVMELQLEILRSLDLMIKDYKLLPTTKKLNNIQSENYE